MGVELAAHGRWYNGVDEHKGMRFKRVSTCLNAINKPQLSAWREKQLLDAVNRELITLQSAQVATNIEAVLEAAKDSLTSMVEETADFGTQAHDIIQRLTSNEPADELTGDMAEVVRAWLEWRIKTDIVIHETEVTVYSDKLMVAGTIDWIGHDKEERLVIGDYKTGGVWPEAAYQLAAYARLWSDMGNPPISRGLIVQLSKDGTFTEYEISDLRGEALDVFLATRSIVFAGDKPWM